MNEDDIGGTSVKITFF